MRKYLDAFLILIVVVLFLFKYQDIKCSLNYEFINENAYCFTDSVIDKKGYASLQSDLDKYIEENKEDGYADEVAVYFRDLNAGPIFGIKETADFAPASLLKLPLALVYFKIAEEDPSILEEKIYFRSPYESRNQNFAPASFIKPNREYRVLELLESMLVNSDNDAYLLLYEYLENEGVGGSIYDTYLELGILAPDDAYDEVISVRRYASIFRALYNVSYLNSEYSEKILGWLTKTSFRSGLNGGNFGDMRVSHKFGERFSEDGTKQLHDCGIVYFPDNPYLLCVMTKGKDFDKLSGIIRHISDEVRNEVISRKL